MLHAHEKMSHIAQEMSERISWSMCLHGVISDEVGRDDAATFLSSLVKSPFIFHHLSLDAKHALLRLKFSESRAAAILISMDWVCMYRYLGRG